MIEFVRWLNSRTWPVLTILLVSFVTYASLWPLPEMPLPSVAFADKFWHAAAYAALAFPIALKRPRHWRVMILGFFIWSAIMELIQPSVNRLGEWADLFANGIGLCTAVILAAVLRAIAHYIEGKRTISFTQPASEEV